MSPLCIQKGRHIGLLLTLIFMSHQFSVCALCSLRLSCRRSNTRCWPNVGLLLAHRLRRWANFSPVLGDHVVFEVTLHVGQRHRRRANINPAFVQSIVWVLQPAWIRPTDYGWMDTSQHRRRWLNIYQTLGRCRLALPDPQPSKHEVLNQCWFYDGQRRRIDQHWVNVSCLLGVLTGHICVLYIIGCEDIKTVAQLIEPKNDLVTVYHLPGSKSWHSEVSGVANLAGEDAVDIKTSNSYQPLWLRCWRGDIPSFFLQKD